VAASGTIGVQDKMRQAAAPEEAATLGRTDFLLGLLVDTNNNLKKKNSWQKRLDALEQKKEDSKRAEKARLDEETSKKEKEAVRAEFAEQRHVLQDTMNEMMKNNQMMTGQ